jgi:flagellum-specific peptidoglycan hydrolase FlgJ
MDFKKLSPEQMKIAEMVIDAAEEHGVDPNLLLAQAFRESGFRHIPNKETDAFGVMQIRPGTAQQNKLGDIRDLKTNIRGGARLMKQYLGEYGSPEAALLAYHQGPGVAEAYIKSGGDLKSVGPKGLDYVINIGENGGFGQPANPADVGNASQEDNPNNPFAAGVPLADKAREGATTQSTTESEPVERDVVSPAIGAALGAGANAILPMFMEEPRITPRVDTGKAEEANLSAQDKLELARRNLQNAAPEGTVDLEETYRQNQGELERLRNEQRLAEASLKGLPKTPPIMEMPAPSSTPPQTVREGRASGPKVEGDSGTRNWMIQEAGQRHQLPEAVLDIATDKTKDSPTGGKRLINEDLANLEKIKRLGYGDYGLTTTEGGLQIQLPPTNVEQRQADIDKQNQANQAELEQRAEQARIQQQAQTQQLEQQRLAQEAELSRLSQERAQLGQQQNTLASELKRVAPIQKAASTAQDAAELARRKLARANQQPNAVGRVLEKAGVNSTKIGPVGRTVTGGLAGYAGVMSLEEALRRRAAGDTSEAVLKAIQAGSAALAVLPPAGKRMTKLKGLGGLGAVGSYGYDFARDIFKDAPPEQ